MLGARLNPHVEARAIAEASDIFRTVNGKSPIDYDISVWGSPPRTDILAPVPAEIISRSARLFFDADRILSEACDCDAIDLSCPVCVLRTSAVIRAIDRYRSWWGVTNTMMADLDDAATGLIQWLAEDESDVAEREELLCDLECVQATYREAVFGDADVWPPLHH